MPSTGGLQLTDEILVANKGCKEVDFDKMKRRKSDENTLRGNQLLFHWQLKTVFLTEFFSFVVLEMLWDTLDALKLAFINQFLNPKFLRSVTTLSCFVHKVKTRLKHTAKY